ncbi:Uncharacterised protein [Mycobacteroides abscessus subsp. abscessus]|nr:Uncharacterised protein [Mycobacteroides abscessus subsp. abscessus]
MRAASYASSASLRFFCSVWSVKSALRRSFSAVATSLSAVYLLSASVALSADSCAFASAAFASVTAFCALSSSAFFGAFFFQAAAASLRIFVADSIATATVARSRVAVAAAFASNTTWSGVLPPAVPLTPVVVVWIAAAIPSSSADNFGCASGLGSASMPLKSGSSG